MVFILFTFHHIFSLVCWLSNSQGKKREASFMNVATSSSLQQLNCLPCASERNEKIVLMRAKRWEKGVAEEIYGFFAHLIANFVRVWINWINAVENAPRVEMRH
jgi:hypothetical protein